jgi:hypothetical protein
MGKNLLSIVLIIIGVILGWFISSFFGGVSEGKVLVDQSAVDSLRAFTVFVDSIENLPMEPTVTQSETIYVEVPKYITTEPIAVVDPIDSTVTHFSDSLLIEKEINVWVDIMVRGHVNDLKVQWVYVPVLRIIETTTERPVYHPIITTIKVPKYVTGHYLSAVAGGNANLFTFGIDYDVVKRDRVYGLQYRRQGDLNVYSVKIGINLRTLFKL